MARICIVTRNAPAANPRVVKEADALIEAGYTVSVVYGIYGGWVERESSDVLPKGCRAVPVRFGPTAPKRARAGQLAIRGLSLALSRVIRSESLAFRANGDAGPALAAAARGEKAELYIGHYTDGLGAAARAAEFSRVPFAFDAEDFHPGDLPDTPQHALKNRIIRLLESRYLPRAVYVSAASPGIADAYAASYGIERPTVVLNTFLKSRLRGAQRHPALRLPALRCIGSRRQSAPTGGSSAQCVPLRLLHPGRICICGENRLTAT